MTIPDFAQIALSAIQPEYWDLTNLIVLIPYFVFGFVLAAVYVLEDSKATDEKACAIFLFWPLLVVGLFLYMLIGVLYLGTKGLFEFVKD